MTSQSRPWIDARMMAQIKAAWFVVADLTQGNKGAYWEAGYASGLGEPVIYTCEQSVWDKEKTHFDTSHHFHIPWSVAHMATVVQKLKATIRITIPEEHAPLVNELSARASHALVGGIERFRPFTLADHRTQTLGNGSAELIHATALHQSVHPHHHRFVALLEVMERRKDRFTEDSGSWAAVVAPTGYEPVF